MEKADKLSDAQFYKEVREIIRIANEAVAKAKAENKRFGIPEFFSRNGKIYFILESGEITTEKPDIYNK